MSDQLIAVSKFCSIYNVELSFIQSLNDFGFVKIIHVDDDDFVHSNQLSELEKIMRLHDEFGINLEGIETINHLLEKINLFQTELNTLRNRLRLYEDFE
jgi:hypothetical protein